MKRHGDVVSEKIEIRYEQEQTSQNTGDVLCPWSPGWYGRFRRSAFQLETNDGHRNDDRRSHYHGDSESFPDGHF